MNSEVEGEQWTIIPSTVDVPSTTMASSTTPGTQPDTKSPTAEPKLEDKQNTTAEPEPTSKSEKKSTEFITSPQPSLERLDTADSVFFEDEIVQRPRPRRVHIQPTRRSYSPEPAYLRPKDEPEPFAIPAMHSSTKMLAQLNNYDGVVDLPFPARSSIYLATFPFSDREIKKYGWLFAHGAEDTFLFEPKKMGGDLDEVQYPIYPNRHPRNRGEYYDPLPFEDNIPRILLSRALDTAVVPEDKGAKFWLVVQNRQRPNGYKLVVMENRKAAGIVIYYEALNGNSIVFVGAVVGERKTGAGIKMKSVESFDEAVQLQEEGIVGIVC